METIQIWAYQKEELDKIGRLIRHSNGIPQQMLINYCDIIDYLIAAYRNVNADWASKDSSGQGSDLTGKNGVD